MLLTLLSGLVQGQLGQRWNTNLDADDAARRVARVPMRCGDWVAEESAPFEPSVVALLRCTGHFQRTYRHARTGAQIHVSLARGPAGPLAAHTPEVCFPAQNYQALGTAELIRLPTPGPSQDELGCLTFRSASGAGRDLRVTYAWCAGDVWQAPRSARIAFGGQTALYKLQMVADCSPDLAAADRNTRSFLKSFLPTLRETLLIESER